MILEELDFADLSHLRPLVARKLSDFHFENFDEVVCDILEKTLRVPLGEDGFTLSQVSRPSRLSELEFIFPITALTRERLRKVFQMEELPLAIDRLQFAPANGFMKGFIDLVFEHEGRFYFVDWKSNWLGADSASYTPESVTTEMARHFYNLQLGIYAVALHRYLERRLPDYESRRIWRRLLYFSARNRSEQTEQRDIFNTPGAQVRGTTE